MMPRATEDDDNNDKGNKLSEMATWLRKGAALPLESAWPKNKKKISPDLKDVS